MPLGDPLPGLLEQLRESDPRRRVSAALRIARWDTVPVEAAPTLVLALEDEEGVDHEDWTDWAGTVVGGELHRVSEYAARALAKCGFEGVRLAVAAASGGAAGARAELPQVLVHASPDVLVELGAERRAQAHACLRRDPDVRRSESGTILDPAARLREAARACLDWAEEEDERQDPEWQRVARRLGHPRPEVAREAAEAMRRCPDKVWAAATLADALLVEDLSYTALTPAARSLEELGPILDERRFQVLLEKAREHQPFGALGPLFRHLAAYGREAASLAPALVAWLAPKPPRQVGREYHRALRAAAARALGMLGEHARGILKELRAHAAAKGPDQAAAREALATLTREDG